ncbi:hypothetical protein [Streptomyces sp. NPDC047453]|uniref:hypothetical protein n=1 Tax=Streptomyces sp. NPDC047453 TaxID=3154812 RepID=UPI0033CF4DEA
MATSDAQPRLLPQPVREKLRSIVFDTNSFPNGGLRLSTLKEWERRARLAGLEIWLPEPVVWELAEHAATTWDEYQAITNKAGKALSHAGLEVPTGSPYGSRDEVIQEVEGKIRSLGTALRVLQLDGDVAVEALKDQVLQRAPAKPRDGVKTGASDSAWLRQVLKTAGDDPDQFVIVGSDRDVYKAFEAWKRGKPWMVPLRDLQEALFVLDEPDDSVVQKIATFLRSLVGSPLKAGGTPDGRLVLGEVKDLAGLVDDWQSDRIHDVSLVQLEAFAGFNQVKINRLTGVVTAQVFLCPTVAYTSWSLDAEGEARTHSGAVPGIVVRDVLSFTLENGAVVKAESESGEAVAFGVDDGASAGPEEAFNELLDVLTLIPGVESKPGLSDAITELEVGGELTVFLDNHTLAFTSEEDHDGGWRATVDLSKTGSSKSIELNCAWDATRNPYEMPDLFPDWVVYTDANVAWGVLSEWGALVWITENLVPEEDSPATSTL